MRVKVLVIGHTHEPYVKEGIARYTKRLPHYCTFEYVELKDISTKGLTPELQKSKEGDLILKQLKFYLIATALQCLTPIYRQFMEAP